MDDQPDLLAGRYLLGEVLGSGGAARVHRGWDTRLDRPVAVKSFHGEPDDVEARRFDQEGRTLATLTHPLLVGVYDSGVDRGRPFLVLRLVEGTTLRRRIAESPLTVDETVRLGARLAEALAYVHDQGVIHRDIKPSNVLLDADGLPYLSDFGVARLSGSRRITPPDHMVGTAAYLAPEQVRGTEVGTPSDVYALGLVLLECLTGVVEYDGGDVETAIARLYRPPAVPEHLPDGLALLLTRMTALNARKRPTANEVAEGLADSAAWAAGPVGRRRPLVVAAASLIAAVGVVAWGGGSTAPIPQTAIPAPTESAEPAATSTSSPPGPTDEPRPAPPAWQARPAQGTVVVVATEPPAGSDTGGKAKPKAKAKGKEQATKRANPGRGRTPQAAGAQQKPGASR